MGICGSLRRYPEPDNGDDGGKAASAAPLSPTGVRPANSGCTASDFAHAPTNGDTGKLWPDSGTTFATYTDIRPEVPGRTCTERLRLLSLYGLLWRGTPVQKDRFVSECWLPFMRLLQDELIAVRTRAACDFSKEERMPSQRRVLELSRACMDLTERWYGKGHGNVSAIYEWLMEAADYSGEAAYNWRDIPCHWSPDDFVRIVDGKVRWKLQSAMYATLDKQAGPMSSGALSQLTGESPIDNTVLPNILTPLQARVVVAGGHIKSFILRLLVSRQKRLLRKLGVALGVDLEHASADVIKTVLLELAQEHQHPDLGSALSGLVPPASAALSGSGGGGGATVSAVSLAADSDMASTTLSRGSSQPVPPGVLLDLNTLFVHALPKLQQAQDGDTTEAKGLTRADSLKPFNSKVALTESAVAAGDVSAPASSSVLSRLGIDPQTVSYSLLAQRGHVLQSWGQLTQPQQHRCHEFIRKQLTLSYLKQQEERRAQHDHHDHVADDGKTQADAALSHNGSADSKHTNGVVTVGAEANLLSEFVEFQRTASGRYFRNDKRLHKQLLLLGMWTHDIAVLKRSAIEHRTVQRYVPLQWTRSVNLIRLEEDGTETVLRPAGVVEYSRLRKNAFPYGDSHGMGLSSGGLAEGLEAHGTLGYELGAALSQDPSAKLPNWDANDVEKILVELLMLNPHSSRCSHSPHAENTVDSNSAAHLTSCDAQYYSVDGVHANHVTGASPPESPDPRASLQLLRAGLPALNSEGRVAASPVASVAANSEAAGSEAALPPRSTDFAQFPALVSGTSSVDGSHATSASGTPSGHAVSPATQYTDGGRSEDDRSVVGAMVELNRPHSASRLSSPPASTRMLSLRSLSPAASPPESGAGMASATRMSPAASTEFASAAVTREHTRGPSSAGSRSVSVSVQVPQPLISRHGTHHNSNTDLDGVMMTTSADLQLSRGTSHDTTGAGPAGRRHIVTHTAGEVVQSSGFASVPAGPSAPTAESATSTMPNTPAPSEFLETPGADDAAVGTGQLIGTSAVAAAATVPAAVTVRVSGTYMQPIEEERETDAEQDDSSIAVAPSRRSLLSTTTPAALSLLQLSTSDSATVTRLGSDNTTASMVSAHSGPTGANGGGARRPSLGLVIGSDRTHVLPGEELHEVSQNSKAGSSIGKTQHTQIFRAVAEDWPIITAHESSASSDSNQSFIPSNPTAKWNAELQSFVDFYQLGTSPDAFYLRLQSQLRGDSYKKITILLQDLRLHLLRTLGARKVDFQVSAFPHDWCGAARTGGTATTADTSVAAVESLSSTLSSERLVFGQVQRAGPLRPRVQLRAQAVELGLCSCAWFTVIFAPVAQLDYLDKKDVAEDKRPWMSRPYTSTNPESGLNPFDFTPWLPIMCLDSVSVKGGCIASSPEEDELAMRGRPMLHQVVQYTSKLKSRQISEEFVKQRMTGSA